MFLYVSLVLFSYPIICWSFAFGNKDVTLSLFCGERNAMTNEYGQCNNMALQSIHTTGKYE